MGANTFDTTTLEDYKASRDNCVGVSAYSFILIVFIYWQGILRGSLPKAENSLNYFTFITGTRVERLPNPRRDNHIRKP